MKSTITGLLFITVFFFCKLSFAQQQEDFIGDWKVVKIEMKDSSQKDAKQMLEMTKKMLLNSVFHFETGNAFSFDCPSPEMRIKKAVWKYDEKKHYIKVTGKVGDNKPSLLMGLYAKATDGRYLFLMEDMPVVMTVTKM